VKIAVVLGNLANQYVNMSGSNIDCFSRSRFLSRHLAEQPGQGSQLRPVGLSQRYGCSQKRSGKGGGGGTFKVEGWRRLVV
jgi:hypothetical protein